jgi:hypothetical protein
MTPFLDLIQINTRAVYARYDYILCEERYRNNSRLASHGDRQNTPVPPRGSDETNLNCA